VLTFSHPLCTFRPIVFHVSICPLRGTMWRCRRRRLWEPTTTSHAPQFPRPLLPPVHNALFVVVMDPDAAAQLLWSPSSSSWSCAEVVLSAVAATAAVGLLSSRALRRRGLRNSARCGGSTLGRLPNSSSLRLHAAKGLARDYFCRNSDGQPAAWPARFAQQWRMSRAVYERIRVELVKEPYFRETRRHATGCQSCSTDQKMCAALMQLVDGVSSRAVWNYLKIGSSTGTESLKQFFRRCCASLQRRGPP